ncbi:hypothetical protein PHLGIDRAFT_37484 [Phlebiopsis gigantea 11061_1 CR5-6]|uniref:DinB-like domain-containing protein n=1 Tax=Phlebiopsis gigantea (strain 11061_1 CR5-6) TaxID=745531 RepID=A0A0C3RSI2_PHLG1|nr:hypothetical protein PHLGIDRAFT_37484 [Phlebiopsis gigantea 11061_1 CR5-6]
MSSPSLSDRSLPSSSRSPTPSTAPSTPTHAPPTHFIVTHSASAAFLHGLPAKKATTDYIFLFSGEGNVEELLNQASDVLEDKELVHAERWMSVKSRDNDGEIMYLCTKSDAANVSTSRGVALAELHVHTTQLSEAAALNLCTTSGLRSILTMQSNNLTLYILERPSFTFPLLSLTPSSPLNPVCNPYTTPSLAEFQLLWKAWDLVTLGMIPPSMLHQKPIDLRHKPLFYIGHLPTFNALLLTKLLRVPMVEPRSYATIFERGIDPHVDDPDHCHNHSVVPERDEDWPVLGEVLGFRDRVRRLVETTLGELARGERTLTRRMARTLMMLHEHEAWHIEWTSTLLDAHAGFDGTTIFPGYSSDFFDSKHQVVLGASYATIPRLAERRTVRNFYQHNYPYPWVGARVVYDA